MSLKCRNFAAAISGARCALLIFCVFFALSAESFAQSRRGVKTKESARIESKRRAEIPRAPHTPPPDSHYFFGRVTGLIDSKYALVKVSSLLNVNGMTATYYACDETMTPTAIIAPTGIFHKMCAVFETLDGTMLKGDCIMVKYSAN